MTITLKVSKNTVEEMKKFYIDSMRPKTPPYAVFQANSADTVVTVYESGKAVFQGVSADIDGNMWASVEKRLNPTKNIDMKNSDDKKKEDKKEDNFDKRLYYKNTIGSDEVGTGDYFGPIVVAAAYITKEDIPFLEELKVNDSKKLKDETILNIVPKLIKKIPYEAIILTNKEYNEKYNKDTNMNKIKAILHNKVLSNLLQKYKPEAIIVDEFAKPYVYYNYLKESNNVVKGITFTTKAETKVLSVAVASMIARYIFLKEIDKMGEKLDTFLPKGASDLVDKEGVNLVKKYGIDILKDIAKLNFKNTDKIKEAL